MNPIEVGQSYDAITARWESPSRPLPGLDQHRRAIKFLDENGDAMHALDVGCGCNGRLSEYLTSEGLDVEGVDVSEQMIALARRRAPELRFHHGDICDWELPRQYDFITAWDSIWHVPLDRQQAVLRKLCDGLNERGVLIFTMGGTDQPGEVRDAEMGVPMYTASLGVPKTLEILAASGCVCRHLEYDQYPQLHVYVIAQKV